MTFRILPPPRQKRTRNSSWEREEAINKAFSRALKENKKAFVQLFLDYGADIARYSLRATGQNIGQTGGQHPKGAASASSGGWNVLNKLNRYAAMRAPPFEQSEQARREAPPPFFFHLENN